jgi:hypothetical protein
LRTGLLWGGRLGKGHNRERSHLLALLLTLPVQALVVADAVVRRPHANVPSATRQKRFGRRVSGIFSRCVPRCGRRHLAL